jgi:hypothetical protein
MLHVTNGDSAVATLTAAGLPGRCLAWRDVLHEGPVPAAMDEATLRATRARFIADRGWGAYDDVLRSFIARDGALARALDDDEVVLWFEHDLYDQLQLCQVLDRLAPCRTAARATITIVLIGDYIGTLPTAAARSAFDRRVPLDEAHRQLGRDAWTAFRSADPAAIVTLLARDTTPLPWLAAALWRHLAEFPGVQGGLSSSERNLLEAIDRGRDRLADAFPASHHDCEDPVFLGDAVFASYVERLSTCRVPLVTLAGGGPVVAALGTLDRAWWDARVALTPAGRDVLAGQDDHVRLNAVDRWLGGVHLGAGRPLWRWDGVDRNLTQAVA